MKREANPGHSIRSLLLVGVLLGAAVVCLPVTPGAAMPMTHAEAPPELCALLGAPNALQAQYHALAAALELPEDLAGNGLPDREALEWVRATLCDEDATSAAALRDATRHAFALNQYLLQREPAAASLAIFHPLLAAMLLLDDATQAALLEHLAAQDIQLQGDYAVVQRLDSGPCAPMKADGHALWEQYHAFPDDTGGLYHPYSPAGARRQEFNAMPKAPIKQTPIGIDSIEALQRLGNDPDYPLDGYYVLTQDIDASATATWNNGQGFEPIGDYDQEEPELRFNGILDGQGFVITGLHIDRTVVPGGAIGLFGYTGEDSVLYRIGLEGGQIIGQGAPVGGLVGSGQGTILQSYTNIPVTGDGLLGGLVGEYIGMITRSYATGAVSGSYYFVGGLGGNVSGAVTECFAVGDVEGDANVGGLLGAGEAALLRCYALGDVHSAREHAAGLVAWKIGGVISECYATSAVTGEEGSSAALVGVFTSPGTVEATFWDMESSGIPTSEWGEGRSTAEMQTQDTFTAAGWDFENDWGIEEGAGYPYLRQIETVTLRIFRWPTAASITFGQALAESALTRGVASVSGSFAFETPGAMLNAGTHPVNVTFTPEDPALFDPVTESIEVVVTPATPNITAWPTASDITYGDSLADSTLSGGAADVVGDFLFEDDNVQPDAGTHTAAVGFYPLSSNNYVSVSSTVDVVVRPRTPEVSAWPEASPIPYGQPLSASNLEGGAADVVGSFVFEDGALQLEVGAHTVTVVFQPEDGQNHASVTHDLEVEVHRATPVIHNWPTAASITYGQTLADSSLSSGAVSVPGEFIFVAPGTAPEAGDYVASVLFLPEDSARYVEVSGDIDVMVHKADTEVTTWPTASTISYGQQLSDSILSGGEASVPGNFSFATSGQQLSAGQHTVTIMFTPTDSNNFWSVEGSVDVVIEPATPQIALWPNASDIDYGAPLSESVLSDGMAGMDGDFEFDEPTLVLEPGEHMVGVTFYPVDPDNFTPVSGTVTVAVIPPPTTEAPNVVGMRQADAEAALTAVELDFTITEVYSETVAEGRVAGQDPAAGTEVAPDATVELFISLGPEKVAVPDLVGMTQAEAVATLATHNLSVGQVSEAHSDTAPAGQLISHHPAADTPIAPGSTVALVVSLGESEKTPAVCGRAGVAPGHNRGNLLLLTGLAILLVGRAGQNRRRNA